MESYDSAFSELQAAEANFKKLLGSKVNIAPTDYAGREAFANSVARAQQELEAQRTYVQSLRGRDLAAKIEAATAKLELLRETRIRTDLEWRSAIHDYEVAAKSATALLASQPGTDETIAACYEVELLRGKIAPYQSQALAAEQNYTACDRELQQLVVQLKTFETTDQRSPVVITNMDEFREAIHHVTLVRCDKNPHQLGLCGLLNGGSSGFQYFADTMRSDRRYILAINQFHFALGNRDLRPEMYKILNETIVPCECKDCARATKTRELFKQIA